MFTLPVMALKSKTLDRQVRNGHEDGKLHFVHNMVLRQTVMKFNLSKKLGFRNEATSAKRLHCTEKFSVKTNL